MLKKISTLAVCLFAVCAVGGAQSPGAQLVGKWALKDLVDPSANAQLKAMMDKAKQQLATGFVRFGQDKSFVFSVGGVEVIKGSWKISDRQISITPSSLGGKPMSEVKAQASQMSVQHPEMAPKLAHIGDDLKASLGADGKTVTLLPSVGNTGNLIFSKTAG